ncbi:hypothetical protein KAU33_16375 [Candidatus Dependentiae bacterium]|nr:hypothetical protein [Candidatus Dependentiae bacterium]
MRNFINISILFLCILISPIQIYSEVLSKEIPDKIPGNIYFYAGIKDFEKHYNNLQKTKFWLNFSKSDIKKDMHNSRKGLRFEQELKKYENILGFKIIEKNFRNLLSEEVAVALYEFKDLHSIYIVKVDKEKKVKKFLKKNKNKLKPRKYLDVEYYGYNENDPDNTFAILFDKKNIFISNQIDLILKIIDIKKGRKDIKKLSENREFMGVNDILNKNYNAFAYFDLDRCAENSYFQRYWYPQDNHEFNSINSEFIIYEFKKKYIIEDKYFNIKDNSESISINTINNKIFHYIPRSCLLFIAKVEEEFNSFFKKYITEESEISKNRVNSFGHGSIPWIWKETIKNKNDYNLKLNDLNEIFGNSYAKVNIFTNEKNSTEYLSVFIVERKKNPEIFKALRQILEDYFNNSFHLSTEKLIKLNVRKKGQFKIFYPNLPNYPPDLIPAFAVTSDFFFFPSNLNAAELFIAQLKRGTFKRILNEKILESKNLKLVYRINFNVNRDHIDSFIKQGLNAYWLTYSEQSILRRDMLEMHSFVEKIQVIEGVRVKVTSHSEKEKTKYYFK